MRTITILKLSTAVALGMASLSTAAAQSEPAAPEGAEAGEAGLMDIVVTAQRRSENLQKAALAITAVSSESLVRAGVSDTAQLTAVAPSLQIGSIGGSATQFYLRGVGNFTTNSLSDAAVSVNLDGVAIARSSAVQGMFYDLERVEVLKGPQGTLYGRNATGGAINIITAKPELGELSGYVTAEYGNFDAVKLNAALNLPAGEDGAFRIAGFLSDHDGYMSDGASDEKTRAIRLQIRSKLTDGLEVTLGGDYAYVGGEGPGSTIVGLDFDDRIGRRDPRVAPFFTSVFTAPAADFLSFRNPDVYQSNAYFGIYAQADIETSVGTLTILPAFRDADINYLACTAQCFIDTIQDQQFTLEARLASNSTDRFNYLLGLYFLDEDGDEKANFNQQLAAFYPEFTSNTKSYAGFARFGYEVTDSFRLTAAGRYTIDKKSAFIDSYNGVAICTTFNFPTQTGAPCLGTPLLPLQLTPPDFLVSAIASGAGFPGPGGTRLIPYGPSAGSLLQVGRSTISPERTFKKFTYRLGFEYDVGPESLLYGSFETGFKSGGFFSSIDNPTFEPETIDAWTIGSKNRFFGNRLQLNLEAFWWNYKDQQFSHFSTNSQGGTEFVTENIGKTRIRGFEVEARARVAEGTTLNGMVQYLDAKSVEFVYENPISAGPPVTACPFQATSTGTFRIDCSGRRAVNAPEWLISGGVEQVFELNNGRIVFNADGRYQSEIMAGLEQLPGQRQKGYFIGDLQLKYEMDEPNIYIAGFVNNVTDQNVASFVSPHPRGGTQLLVATLRPPRTYGVRVGYRF